MNYDQNNVRERNPSLIDDTKLRQQYQLQGFRPTSDYSNLLHLELVLWQAAIYFSDNK